MRTHAAQIILAAAALVIGLTQPTFNGLSMLALAMVTVAGVLEWRSGTTVVGGGAESAGQEREAA